MTASEKIYKSILRKLSLIPVDYLKQVDAWLQKFTQEIEFKERNRMMILELAGGWNDMRESDFQEYLSEAKGAGNDMFNRDIELKVGKNL